MVNGFECLKNSLDPLEDFEEYLKFKNLSAVISFQKDRKNTLYCNVMSSKTSGFLLVVSIRSWNWRIINVLDIHQSNKYAKFHCIVLSKCFFQVIKYKNVLQVRTIIFIQFSNFKNCGQNRLAMYASYSRAVHAQS